ncbi:MAG TPA: lamin tail domain-containing protein, partial [Kofleriaceae bacterium]|nr:lamin tail domain-containing protein [Kofleriaceae bacterium]
PPLDAGVPDAPPPPPAHLRLVAGNLTSGNNQAYLAPGIHIFRALDADVAMIQEFNVGGNSASEIRTFIDQAFGPAYSFTRGAASGQIPNGIVSRYPIIASGEWIDTEVANRTFVWAQIDIPGPIDLYAISVHLLSSSASERNIEAGELVTRIRALPADAYVVLGGDFNTDSRTEGAIQRLSAVLVTGAPWPADQNAEGNTNANRNKPFDWVLASSNLNALESPTVIGNRTFAHGFVADTRVYTPIADFPPALATDSGAPNMQHMGVARDFQLSGVAPSAVRVISPNGGEVWGAGTSQLITWTAVGTASVKVELSTDGTSFTTLAAAAPAAAGQLAITAPSVTTSAARVRITAEPAGTPVDLSDAAFSITAGPPPVARVFINEVRANEPGTDVNGEFIELVNTGTADQDLSGWTLSDSSAVRHTFAAGSVLRAGKAIVVFGGAAAIPTGLGNAVAASTGTLALTNSADTVTLRSPAAQIDTMSFATAQPDGVSLNRSPDADPTGSFVLHTTLTTQPSSPGTRVSGAAF